MRIILDTDNEQNFVDLWNPEKNNWERYIKCEEKKETKPITEESIEALGYACGEIQKCFTNGWVKSLKNKSLNEKDKKIKKYDTGLTNGRYTEDSIKTGLDNDTTIENIIINMGIEITLVKEKMFEIIDYINGGANGE